MRVLRTSAYPGMFDDLVRDAHDELEAEREAVLVRGEN